MLPPPTQGSRLTGRPSRRAGYPRIPSASPRSRWSPGGRLAWLGRHRGRKAWWSQGPYARSGPVHPAADDPTLRHPVGPTDRPLSRGPREGFGSRGCVGRGSSAPAAGWLASTSEPLQQGPHARAEQCAENSTRSPTHSRRHDEVPAPNERGKEAECEPGEAGKKRSLKAGRARACAWHGLVFLRRCHGPANGSAAEHRAPLRRSAAPAAGRHHTESLIVPNPNMNQAPKPTMQTKAVTQFGRTG